MKFTSTRSSVACALLLALVVISAASARGDDKSSKDDDRPQRDTGPKRWEQMDYGPFISATVAATWPEKNTTYKGIAFRVGDHDFPTGGFVFDTELLRYSAVWTGGYLNL